MVTVTRVGLAALAVAAGAAFADDAVWMQQKDVAIGAGNFQQCVATAVAAVPGVSVNRASAGSASKVPLEVKFARPIRFLDVEVQHRGGNASIVFIGRGASEPKADRQQITPMLDAIAGSIARTCGAAKK